jgi:hypothetical protein
MDYACLFRRHGSEQRAHHASARCPMFVAFQLPVSADTLRSAERVPRARYDADAAMPFTISPPNIMRRLLPHPANHL